MRSLGEISSSRAEGRCKISLFAWNGKFIVKFEQGPCEQVFKFDQFEVSGEDQVREIAADKLIEFVLENFDRMQASRMEVI